MVMHERVILMVNSLAGWLLPFHFHSTILCFLPTTSFFCFVPILSTHRFTNQEYQDPIVPRSNIITKSIVSDNPMLIINFQLTHFIFLLIVQLGLSLPTKPHLHKRELINIIGIIQNVASKINLYFILMPNKPLYKAQLLFLNISRHSQLFILS
jgi:hypothetical protein